MRRKAHPSRPDPRPSWMIDQGLRCGCRGTDDMCLCQNENPWPRLAPVDTDTLRKVTDILARGHVAVVRPDGSVREVPPEELYL